MPMRVAYEVNVNQPRPYALGGSWVSPTRSGQRWNGVSKRPEAPDGRSWSYASDTIPRNIDALLHDPLVEDTLGADRNTLSVPWASKEESDQWIWIADRMPVVHYRRVRLALMAILTAMAIAGFDGVVSTLRERRRSGPSNKRG